MFLNQFFVKGLGHASYLIGDPDDGSAAVIDPRRDVDAYLDMARDEGLRITDVLETHVHNDYVSGAEELERATVLDVREASEWRDGHVPDAVHIPGAQLPSRIDEVPDGPVLVICGSGYRSAIAASLLLAANREEIAYVVGGMDAYRSAGLPVATDAPATPAEGEMSKETSR